MNLTKWELLLDVEYGHEGYYTIMISNDAPQPVPFGTMPAAGVNRVPYLSRSRSSSRTEPGLGMGVERFKGRC